MIPVKFGLIGIGGYARQYVRALVALEDEKLGRFVSAAIRTPGKYPKQEEVLAERKVQIRRSMEELLEKDHDDIEVVAIPTGIESHRDQMIQAVEAGYHVMLEKPPAATIQEVDEMQASLERTGKCCAVGFQSQSSRSIVNLKKEICTGRLGKIKEAVVVGAWKRMNTYFTRNNWAGRFKIGEHYTLDGTINNPLAHYLFNALYFVSQEWGKAAVPASVRAELYHAHQIESEDTSCLEIITENGPTVYFYSTLCTTEEKGPIIEIFGERGRAVWDKGVSRIYDGEKQVAEFTDENIDPRIEQFRNLVHYLRGTDPELNCPLAMTRPHVLAVNGAFESAQNTIKIPDSKLTTIKDPTSGEERIEIADILQLIERAAAKRKLFSDIGVEWAKPTNPFSLKNYKRFSIELPGVK